MIVSEQSICSHKEVVLLMLPLRGTITLRKVSSSAVLLASIVTVIDVSCLLSTIGLPDLTMMS